MTDSVPRKLKVCHVVCTTEGAGWIVEQLRELRDRYGYEVAAVLNGPRGTLVDHCNANAIPVHVADFDFTGSPHLFTLPRKVVSLARLFARERFDVVQTHLFHSMVIGRIAAWIADVPLRLSMIAGPFHLEAYTPRWIDRSTCWMDTAIIPSSEYSRRLYREMGISEYRLPLIYYGPDERKFDPAKTEKVGLRAQYGWPDDTPLVGMIAYFYTELGANRWTPPAVHGKAAKGHEDLIQAAAIVLRELPTTKFLLVGSGWQDGGKAHLKRMQCLVGELGLQNSVVFTGFRSDIPQIYRELDVAVQPSLNENLGGTIESLLMECPTVATRVGGLTDSVVDGETGVLVNPRDPPELATGILKLLRDKSTARELAAAGRSRMLTRFTLRTTVQNFYTLYESRANTRGYRPVIVLWRLMAAAILCSGIAIRFLVLDTYVLPRYDRGQRLWEVRPVAPRMWLYRAYALLNLVAPSFGLRRKIHTAANRARMWKYRGNLLRLRNLVCTARAMPRMWRYRAYALLNIVTPSFGLRRKIHTAANRARMWKYRGNLLRLRNLVCTARAMPRMWRYRAYALLNIVTPSFGLRRKIHTAANRARMWKYRGNLLRLRNLVCTARAMPRMWRYRLYASISRLASNFGLRNKF